MVIHIGFRHVVRTLLIICLETILLSCATAYTSEQHQGQSRSAEPQSPTRNQAALSPLSADRAPQPTFMSLYDSGKVLDAQANLQRTLDELNALGLPDTSWQVRWAAAWKHEVDIVIDFDTQHREDFFAHRKKINDIYQQCSIVAFPDRLREGLTKSIAAIPGSIDGRCPTRLDCYEASGYLGSMTGNNEAAYKDFAELKLLRSALVGGDNWMYASDCEQLGLCALALGKVDEAHRLLSECYKLRRDLFGVGAFQSLVAYSNLGALDLHRGEYASAITKLELVHEKFQHNNVNAIVLGTCELHLARAHIAVGDATKGISMFRQAVSDTRKVLPYGHPKVLRMMSSFAEQCSKAGYDDLSTQVRNEALELEQEHGAETK